MFVCLLLTVFSGVLFSLYSKMYVSYAGTVVRLEQNIREKIASVLKELTWCIIGICFPRYNCIYIGMEVILVISLEK
jgi:hypothetical protein